jgi:hypothetical protein
MHYKFHLIIITLPYIKVSKEIQATIMINFYIIILKNQYSNSKKKRYKNNHSTFYKSKSMKMNKLKVECLKCNKYDYINDGIKSNFIEIGDNTFFFFL